MISESTRFLGQPRLIIPTRGRRTESDIGAESNRWKGRMLPPPETSPLSPLPSPSHRPGEGDLAGAVLPIGGRLKKEAIRRIRPITPPTSTIASAGSPSPGRREGDGRGDRGEVPGGGTLRGHEAPELPYSSEHRMPRLQPGHVHPTEPRLLQPAELVEEGRRVIDRVRLGLGPEVPAQIEEFLIGPEPSAQLQGAPADGVVPGLRRQGLGRRSGRLDEVG